VENANELLFLSNLPSNTTEEQLVALFREYPGFKEVRMVPGKAEIAFVEYDNEKHATAAKTVLDGFRITPTHSMKVQFAKR
jgi:RNA recognition motif-containing protein